MDKYGELCKKIAELYGLTPSGAWGWLSLRTPIERVQISFHPKINLQLSLKECIRAWDRVE